jgi:hypothetical protein
MKQKTLAMAADQTFELQTAKIVPLWNPQAQ